jgi:hypothetical protein
MFGFSRLTPINGFNDWYVPAIYEWNIIYRTLKGYTTVTQPNDTSTGSNPYAYPTAAPNYTTTDPSQTTSATFASPGGTQIIDTSDAQGTANANVSLAGAANQNGLWRFGFSSGAAGGGSIFSASPRSRIIRRAPYDAPFAFGVGFAGGFFVGQYVDPSDGIKYNLIVAPAATGQYDPSGTNPSTITYKLTNTADTPAATFQNFYYGRPATQAGANASHPLFQWAEGTINGGGGIGGFTDWYIPAQHELQMMFNNLGPSFCTSATFASGAQIFSTVQPYWSATQYSDDQTTAFSLLFSTGAQATTSKSTGCYARLVRRQAA